MESLALVAAAQPIDEHLFDRLIVAHEHVADGVSAHKVADLFSEILSVIAGALERLGHEDDLQAGAAALACWPDAATSWR